MRGEHRHKGVANSPPHLKPTGRSAKLHLSGMVIAISGLTPENLAMLESTTAQRQLGFWIIFFTWRQQLLETAAFLSLAAVAQGINFKAWLSGEDFPQAPAPSTFSKLERLITKSNPTRKMKLFGYSIAQFIPPVSPGFIGQPGLQNCLHSNPLIVLIVGTITLSHHSTTLKSASTRSLLYAHRWGNIPCLPDAKSLPQCGLS